ncbi:hypothetical protein [Rhodococcus maanshanensis]|uniref:Secretory lipase n=1 Tax=Rhodococcus maanshanensis TaxID=183556 RepID=A0A1H7XJ73_9NOCA|nr:hypothetical protein [Rhodococcus maanshanensis]SEM33962.1 hypothetical protein SAMN05444583_1334 [Rhodococcus maanshanensis]
MRETNSGLDVNSYLTPRGQEILDTAGSQCLPKIMHDVNGVPMGEMLARPLGDAAFRDAIADYMTIPTSGYDAPILLLLNATDVTVPSPLHATLAAQFAANGVDHRSVVGTGKHCELNPQMWAAIDAFIVQMLATPTTR